MYRELEKYCPDYEIIRWDENNYDYKKNRYMAEAYEAKKWSFVSDYARMDILYQYGGIYLDTDVEVIRSFDELLGYRAFMGFEETYVNLGIGFGCEPGLIELKELMNTYEDLRFINPDGSLNLKPITRYTNDYLVKKGFLADGTRQTVGEIEIFPSEYFSPKDYYTRECKITPNTYSIHHYDASWWGDKEKETYRKEVKFREQHLWLWRFRNGIRVLREQGIGTLFKKIFHMVKK